MKSSFQDLLKVIEKDKLKKGYHRRSFFYKEVHKKVNNFSKWVVATGVSWQVLKQNTKMVGI